MSTVKIVDLNRQIVKKSEDLMETLLTYQSETQVNATLLKKKEAELLATAKAAVQREWDDQRLQAEKAAKDAQVRAEAATAQTEAEKVPATEKVRDFEQPHEQEKMQAETPREIVTQGEAERSQQADKSHETERSQQADKVHETERQRETERPRQVEKPRDTDRPRGPVSQSDRPGGYVSQSDRPRGPVSQSDRPGGYVSQSDRPRGPVSQSDRPGGYVSQSDRPRGPVSQSDRPGGYVSQSDRPRGPVSQSDRPREWTDRRPDSGQNNNRNRNDSSRPMQNTQRTQPGNYGRPGSPQQNQPRTAETRPFPNKTQSSTVDKPKTNNYSNKKTPDKRGDDNRNKNMKAAIKSRVFDYDDERMGSRKYKGKKMKPTIMPDPIKIDHAVITTELVSVKTLAERTGKPASEIIKKLFLLGVVCTINSEIEFDTAQLVFTEFGINLEYRPEKTAEDSLNEENTDDMPEDLMTRPPVVTIMGHVDHGKTSLLDAIRSTRVTEQEAGGITQHIGAYQIDVRDRKITFLDTPGHEAFTSMRARGAQVTDIAILVVAADDGIMPQTVEAINHAKSAGVPIIIAINKIDKANANIERVKQELTEYELVPEEWGGSTVIAPVSALTHEGIENLLDMILLVADLGELKANPNRTAKGTIIEARLDKGRGPVATVLIQNGTLRIADTIIAGTAYGRVRAMADENGQPVMEAVPSQPVEVIGFSEVPQAGDLFNAVQQSLSRQVAEERRDKQKADKLKNTAKVSLDDLFSRISEGSIKDLNIIVKADVQGSAEAVTQSLSKLSNGEVQVKVVHQGVGAIQKTDVLLASAANAIIIGFNVRPDKNARETAEKENVDIRLYRIIYNAIEDIEAALKGMLKPVFEEAITGHAQVRQLFKVSSIGTIAGCYVTDGKIVRHTKVRLLRDNVVVFEGELSSLKRVKDDVKEMASGFECGMTLAGFNDIKEGDVIEAFEMREIKK